MQLQTWIEMREWRVFTRRRLPKEVCYLQLIDSITGKSYIGKTQQFLKKRTSDHIADVWKRVEAKKNNKTQPSRKMTHSRGIFLPTVLAVQTPVKSEPN